MQKIISGGQTGADRAALDFAIEKGIEIGGWVPKGRIAEDGMIDESYPNLKETGSKDYAERTRLNVRDSDATIIFSTGELTGGSKLTKELALEYEKPFLHIDFDAVSLLDGISKTFKWLASIDCEVLNVAGPRASGDPEIYENTKEFLTKLFY